nr:hypothetical protein GCM10017611_01610 [Rhodococcus wratislaviensis]
MSGIEPPRRSGNRKRCNRPAVLAHNWYRETAQTTLNLAVFGGQARVAYSTQLGFEHRRIGDRVIGVPPQRSGKHLLCALRMIGEQNFPDCCAVRGHRSADA